MQAEYPKKLLRTYWDPVHVIYPVRKSADVDLSSETITRRWRREPEIIKDVKRPIDQLKEYFHDYNTTKELTKSQTRNDYSFKLPETKRFNKHTSCTENKYIYPPPRNQPTEPSWHKELEPRDTTYEGFEKYLDPYLTTSRLYHRPFTVDQLSRLSCSKEVATYYTFADATWVRTPKPSNNWCLPLSRPKSMNVREKFKEDFREIRTHNQVQFVPGSFHTESRDNYIEPTARSESKIHNYEEDVQTFYERKLANLPTNIQEESSIKQNQYNTENSFYGSRKPLCSMLDTFVVKNERLRKKNSIG